MTAQSLKFNVRYKDFNAKGVNEEMRGESCNLPTKEKKKGKRVLFSKNTSSLREGQHEELTALKRKKADTKGDCMRVS